MSLTMLLTIDPIFLFIMSSSLQTPPPSNIKISHQNRWSTLHCFPPTIIHNHQLDILPTILVATNSFENLLIKTIIYTLGLLIAFYTIHLNFQQLYWVPTFSQFPGMFYFIWILIWIRVIQNPLETGIDYL